MEQNICWFDGRETDEVLSLYKHGVNSDTQSSPNIAFSQLNLAFLPTQTMVSKVVDPEKHLDALNWLYFCWNPYKYLLKLQFWSGFAKILHVIMQRERYTNMAPAITCGRHVKSIYSKCYCQSREAVVWLGIFKISIEKIMLYVDH